MSATLSMEKHAVQAAGLLLAMANVNRLLILDIISQEEMSVGLLAHRVGLSQSALSQHLGKLRGLRLVDSRREAQTIYYFCNSPAVAQILGTLHEIYGLAPRSPAVMRLSA